MKPILMRHIETTTESFKAWINVAPYLHNPWHYHPECELTTIEEGNGVLFAGDNVTTYEKK
jgi:quercetin dioxygenase-like cupin family protein